MTKEDHDHNEERLTEKLFSQLIESLLTPRTTNETFSAPDGMMDCSEIARVLRSFTEQGRAVKSDEPGALQLMIGNWMQREFPNAAGPQIVLCIQSLVVMIQLLLRSVQTIRTDLCPEEILMVALDQVDLDKLMEVLASAPFRLNANGEAIADFMGVRELAEPFVIDEGVKHAFMRRNITRVHYEAHDTTDETTTNDHLAEGLEIVTEAQLRSHSLDPIDEDSDPSKTNDPTTQPPSESGAKSRKVNLSDLGRLTACPLDGFDEFHAYFNATDYVWWDMGINFEDLPAFGETIDPDDYRD